MLLHRRPHQPTPQGPITADQPPSISFSLPLSHYLPFTLLQNGKEGYEKWRVENSWGDDRGNKGKALKKIESPWLHLFPFSHCFQMEPGSTPEVLHSLLLASSGLHFSFGLRGPSEEGVYSIRKRIRLKWKPVMLFLSCIGPFLPWTGVYRSPRGGEAFTKRLRPALALCLGLFYSPPP